MVDRAGHRPPRPVNCSFSFIQPYLVAGPGFEPGMLRAYETGVVASLPAILFTIVEQATKVSF